MWRPKRHAKARDKHTAHQIMPRRREAFSFQPSRSLDYTMPPVIGAGGEVQPAVEQSFLDLTSETSHAECFDTLLVYCSVIEYQHANAA